MFKWFKDKIDPKENEKEQNIQNEQLEKDSIEKEDPVNNFQDSSVDASDELLEEKVSDNQEKVDEVISSALHDENSEINKEVQRQDKEEVIVEENNSGFGFFKKIFAGLEKTRNNVSDKLNDVLGNYVKIDDDMYESIEDILITADVGVDTTVQLIDNLRDAIKAKKITDPKLVMGVLADEAKALINIEHEESYNTNITPTIVLVVGVNGVGKTTTIGKLASKYKNEGKKVLLVAADTFRAAATEQLQEWALRSEVDIIHQKEGSDPAAVVFDAIQAAKARKSDIILCDTAGRLHNKANLMNELEKIYRIIDKNFPEANKQSLVVLDASTGQNALNQARQFKEVAKVSGIVITKLDGTAKGGIIFPIINELKVPVIYMGVGEKIDDLQPFNADAFVDSIFNIKNKNNPD